jgi:hypothetical protein
VTRGVLASARPHRDPQPGLPQRRSFDREVVARVQHLNGITKTTIGTAVHGKRSYPLLACVAQSPGFPDRPWILVSAGVHGDEIAGVYAAITFLETRTRSVVPWFQIAVLPCVNPSGFELDTLETASGANLNRLFGTDNPPPEVVAVDSWLDRSGRRFVATFDLHEACSTYRGEGFEPPDNPRACYLYETQANRTRRFGRAMIDALPPSHEVCRWPFIYKDRNDNGVISYPEACRNPIYAERTTLDAFLNSRFTNHSFTLETPMDWPLEKRVGTHMIWLDAALSRLRAGYSH